MIRRTLGFSAFLLLVGLVVNYSYDSLTKQGVISSDTPRFNPFLDAAEKDPGARDSLVAAIGPFDGEYPAVFGQAQAGLNDAWNSAEADSMRTSMGYGWNNLAGSNLGEQASQLLTNLLKGQTFGLDKFITDFTKAIGNIIPGGVRPSNPGTFPSTTTPADSAEWAKGVEEGRLLAQRETAKKMIEVGIERNKIKEITGMSDAEIDSL